MVGQFGSGTLVQNGGLVTIDSLTIGSGMASSAVVCCSNTVMSNVGVGQITISNGVLRTQRLLVGASSQAFPRVSNDRAITSSRLSVSKSQAAIALPRRSTAAWR